MGCTPGRAVEGAGTNRKCGGGDCGGEGAGGGDAAAGEASAAEAAVAVMRGAGAGTLIGLHPRPRPSRKPAKMRKPKKRGC